MTHLSVTSTVRTSPLTEEDVSDARVLAVEVHATQTYNGQPYLVHLDHVHSLACFYGAPLAVRVAAYLHDMMEDQGITFAVLSSRFGGEVAEMVWSVSGFGETRRERTACIHKKLALRPSDAYLKLLDRLGNCLNAKETGQVKLLKMYRQEMPAYSAMFEAAHPEAYERLCRLFD